MSRRAGSYERVLALQFSISGTGTVSSEIIDNLRPSVFEAIDPNITERFRFEDIVSHINPRVYEGQRDERHSIEWEPELDNPPFTYNSRVHTWRTRNAEELCRHVHERYGSGRYALVFPDDEKHYFILIRDTFSEL